jgi:Ca2+-transporting ATPase
MDGPPAMALGLDEPEADVMRRTPRPMSEKILTKERWKAISMSSVLMAGGTLAVLHWPPGAEPYAGVATVAGTMAFNTFVLFQFFNILNSRSDTLSVFRRATLTNGKLWLALAAVITLQVGVTHFGPMQRLFDTTSISFVQWMIATAIASSVLWAEEIRKFHAQRKNR